jgi:hypothetical protein
MVSKHKPRDSNLLKFHRPRLHLHEAPIPVLSEESKAYANTQLHFPPPKLTF